MREDGQKALVHSDRSKTCEGESALILKLDVWNWTTSRHPDPRPTLIICSPAPLVVGELSLLYNSDATVVMLGGEGVYVCVGVQRRGGGASKQF